MSALRDALVNVVKSSTKYDDAREEIQCAKTYAEIEANPRPQDWLPSTKQTERAQELAHPRALPQLQQGQRFTLHRDCCESQADLERVFEVVRVTAGSAVVRALNARHVVVHDKRGEVQASWEAPGRTFTMSVESSVVLQVQS